jgi:hypothetical protein
MRSLGRDQQSQHTPNHNTGLKRDFSNYYSSQKHLINTLKYFPLFSNLIDTIICYLFPLLLKGYLSKLLSINS